MRLVLLVVSSFIFAFSADMPPMPPGFGASPMPGQVNRAVAKGKKPNTFKKNLSEIPGCNSLPPMIIFLPPPMEKDLIACRNEYFKPTKAKAKEFISKLVGKDVTIKSVSIEEGFREVYKIEYSAKNIFLNKDFTKYCNTALTKCLK